MENSQSSGAVIAAALRSVRSRLPELPEKERVAGLCRQLLARAPEERSAVLQDLDAWSRLAVCRHLLEEAFPLQHTDPGRMHELAQTALQLVEGLDRGEEWRLLVIDVQTEAWIAFAHAANVIGDHALAETAWRRAAALVQEGSGDPLLEARLREGRAALRIDQRRFRLAIDDLLRAEALYRSAGDEHLAGRSLLGLARAHRGRGDLPRAIASLVEGGGRIDLRRDPHCYLAITHNLAVYLDDAGFPEQALEILSTLAGTAGSRRQPLLQLRSRWLEARISATLEHHAAASAILVEVCRAFLDLAMHYDAALAALDLAAVYADRGMAVEVRNLAEDLYPVFIARSIPREASMALILFYRAARTEQASAELLASLRRDLEQLRATS